MENTTPIVGVLTSYGKPYLFGLIRNAIEENKTPYVILESNNAAVAFYQTFRRMYPSVAAVVVGKDNLKETHSKNSVVFTTQEVLLHKLLPYFSPLKPIDFTKHIFYVIPNRIPYDLRTYMNVRMIEESHFRGYDIPYVTMYGVNTQSFPPLQSKYAIFDKHSELIPTSYQLVGKNYNPNDLYEEMAKTTLRMHLSSPGRTIVVNVPSKAEVETFIGYFSLVDTPKLFIHNVYEGGEWMVPSDRSTFTNIYVATDEILHLVMVPPEMLLDSHRAIVEGKSFSGEETTFAIDVPKDVSLSRCSILQNKLSGEKAGMCISMTTKELFEKSSFIPQSVVDELLYLGKTDLEPLDIFIDSDVVQNDLVMLQSIGALNPDNRTTELGNFLMDIPLTPMEGAVLWLYLQEHWIRGKFCLPVLLTTSMISLFSEDYPYYVYPTFTDDVISKEKNHRRRRWSKFAGEDDLETFLNIWLAIFTELETFDPSYEDLEFWGRGNSLNGDRLFMVLRKTQQIQDILPKYGFVCDEIEALEPKKDVKTLRKIYSQIYLLRRMVNTKEGMALYESLSDQQNYSVYYPTSINTISVTNPPEIVAPIAKDFLIFVAVLFRQE